MPLQLGIWRAWSQPFHSGSVPPQTTLLWLGWSCYPDRPSRPINQPTLMGLQWSSGRRTDQSTSAHDFLPPSHTPMELHCHQSSNRSRWPGQAAIPLSLHLQEVQDATPVMNVANNARTVKSQKCGDFTSNNKQPLEAKPVLWPRPPQEPQRALQGNFEELARRSKTEARQEEQHAQAC